MENIKKRILENDYIKQEKIILYKVIGHRRFITRDKLRKKYKPKGIVALYYYYRYLLKLYTQKNIQYKLTTEMRAEVKKIDEYSERIRFLCTYRIETMSDVDNISTIFAKYLTNIFESVNILLKENRIMDNKKDNFKRIAEKRTNKIIESISKLQNLTNTSFYEYTDEQIEAIFEAIQKELDNQKKIFEDDKKKEKKRFEL